MNKLLLQLQAQGQALPELDAGYPLEAARFLPAAPADLVYRLATHTGHPLPDDYRAFLAECAGFDAMDIHNGYALHDPEQQLRYLAQGINFGSVLVKAHLTPVLPIGSNGGGDVFFLVPDHGVWRIDHHLLVTGAPPLALDEPQPGVRHISSSFTGYLQRMLADWQHFVDDDAAPHDYLCG
ncbi:SMI1/KNR4 family protein [Chitinibacteraceae bacterium HSL-7]